MEYTHGLIRDNIKECGWKESSMALELILYLELKESLVYGKMGKE